MAKVGLNSPAPSHELATHGVLVTSVDTWVTDERPWPERSMQEGFACPLDLEDGAALYDPIVRGERGELDGVLLKDYGVAPW